MSGRDDVRGVVARMASRMSGAQPRRRSARGVVAWGRTVAVAVGLFGATTGSLAGQLAWETPRLSGPDRPEGMGVYWLRAGTLPTDGDAILVTWSPPGLGDELTLRGGAGTGTGQASAVFAGADWRSPLTRHALGAPLDVSWSVGGGVGVGDYLLFTLPVGVSVGRAWLRGSAWFAPYASLGLAADVRIGDSGSEERWGVSPAADVGVDFSLDPARRLVFRAAVSLGDRQALVLGAAVRTLR